MAALQKIETPVPDEQANLLKQLFQVGTPAAANGLGSDSTLALKHALHSLKSLT